MMPMVLTIEFEFCCMDTHAVDLIVVNVEKLITKYGLLPTLCCKRFQAYSNHSNAHALKYEQPR